MMLEEIAPLVVPGRKSGAKINVYLLRDLADRGRTPTQIADLMGFEVSSIKQHLRRLGLRAGGRAVSPLDPEKLRELYDTGIPVRQIAIMLGAAQSSVENQIRKQGFPKRRRAKAAIAAEAPVAVAAANADEAAEAIPVATDDAIKDLAMEAVPVVPDVPAPPSAADLTAQVLATKGRYAELAAFAARHGLTQTRALQLYHAARVMR